MSKREIEAIWQPDKVLPYLYAELLQKIETITPVQKIYLYGSRARIPVGDWQTLEGKDWDIMVICKFAIVNTQIWTRDLNYHMDLTIIGMASAETFLQSKVKKIELYPENKLNISYGR